ncbi:DUF1761 domain-containing protein [Metabacillus idriensis]|uniref:DUF1761 domain-containing protein n=1 Tax=Metabacillus idriensis TaxID=324768 RepID=UPI0028148F5D|nr:DUF1761 domain-containing protein [Metabacillus idriensis]MDR0139075.1 DUF1761 domain-containing protein [Metabacillus idriensis]
MIIHFMDLNFLAVMAGGLLYMAFGALYYSPFLFGNIWTRMNPSEVKDSAKYAGSAVVAFLSSFLIAIIIHSIGADDVISGLMTGLIIGILLALAYLKNALFGLTNLKVYGIAVLDHVIAFSLLGILHAIWG